MQQQIRNHIFTHYVKLGTIDNTIHNLMKVFQIIERDYNGKITHEDIGKINRQNYQYEHIIKRTVFIKFQFITLLLKY